MSECMIVRRGGQAKDIFGFIRVTYPVGSTLTATKSGKVLRADDTSGTWMFNIPEAGTWDIVATNGADNVGKSVMVTTIGEIINVELRIPIEYQEVNYLQASSNSYIVLPVKSKNGLIIQTKCGFYGSGEYIFGSSDNWKVNSLGLYIATNTGRTGLLYGNQLDDTSSTIGKNTPFVLTIQNNNWNIYNASMQLLRQKVFTAQTFTGYNNIILFGTKTTNAEPISMEGVRIYTFAISGILNFIPCYRKIDSVAGMWDTVNKQFYTNAGTGAFIVGGNV